MSTRDLTPPPTSQAFYTDADEEYRASRDDAALFDHADSDLLELSGADAERFLQGQTTCDVSSGDACYGFFTNTRGRIESDVTVLRLKDRFRLLLPPGRGSAIGDRLRKYVIADRVEIAAEGSAPLSLVGPRAREIHDRLGKEDATSTPRIDGGYTYWPASEEEKTDLWDALVEAGAMPMGMTAWERRRIEDGIPRFGVDFGPDHFPQETGREDAVSYTKGCYLGQEVVARIHYRGGVKRRLRKLEIESIAEASELTGTEIRLEEGDQAVGKLGSAVDTENGVVGLAIVHDKATVGSTVAFMMGSGRMGSGRVVALPELKP